MKTLSDPTVSAAGKVAEAITSVAKLIIQSRPRPKLPKAPEGSRILILGNGPSLARNLADDAEILRDSTCMAVNFAANTPMFTQVKPAFYILVDPVFFDPDGNQAVASLWRNIASASWPLTLILPAGRKPPVKLGENVRWFEINMVGVEGSRLLENFAFNRRLGMPRPRNVLIPAIMAAIWMEFSEIVILGADHSWTQTLRVDGENRVVSVQPHFYADSDEEHERVAQVYSGVRLHHILHSFYTAFRAYHAIDRYARSRGIRILNATPGSFIDAFERVKVAEI